MKLTITRLLRRLRRRLGIYTDAEVEDLLNDLAAAQRRLSDIEDDLSVTSALGAAVHGLSMDLRQDTNRVVSAVLLPPEIALSVLKVAARGLRGPVAYHGDCDLVLFGANVGAYEPPQFCADDVTPILIVTRPR